MGSRTKRLEQVSVLHADSTVDRSNRHLQFGSSNRSETVIPCSLEFLWSSLGCDVHLPGVAGEAPDIGSAGEPYAINTTCWLRYWTRRSSWRCLLDASRQNERAAEQKCAIVCHKSRPVEVAFNIAMTSGRWRRELEEASCGFSRHPFLYQPRYSHAFGNANWRKREHLRGPVGPRLSRSRTDDRAPTPHRKW
jgi:hypothetical protein